MINRTMESRHCSAAQTSRSAVSARTGRPIETAISAAQKKESKNVETAGRDKEFDKSCSQTGRPPRLDDEPAIERRAHAQPDQRRRDEAGQRNSPKPERGFPRTAFGLDIPNPKLGRLREHRKRVHRFLCGRPNPRRQFHTGHQSRAGSGRRIGRRRRGLDALGGEIGNQAFDLVGRHRPRQLQYDGRAGGLGGPSGRHCAEQKQQRQGKRSCRHCPLFKLKCLEHQTARSNGE